MTRKKEFVEIEQKLYNYYAKDRKISSLMYKIEIIKNQIEKMKKEKIDAESWYNGISYDEKVQTSSTGTSFAEREIIRQESIKERREKQSLEEIEAIKGTIDDIERDNAIIGYNIQFLNKNALEILEMKYKMKYNELKIADKLHMDQSTLNKQKQKILKNIIRWEVWV